MEAGDAMHAFTTELFEDIDRKEAMGVSETLNSILRVSIQMSAFSVEDLKLRVTIGSSSTTGECMNNMSYYDYLYNAAEEEPRLVGGDNIHAFDSLQFQYPVEAPLDIVINESTLKQYNTVCYGIL